MNKHAYLIMAYNNFNQLGTLLQLIDDERNDIFLHIDKKANFSENDKRNLLIKIKKSNIYFTQRISVSWGGFSLLNAELELIHTAVNNNQKYEYYHVLSGQDLPLKSQDIIHDFFEKNKGQEFIHFGSPDYVLNCINRYKYYYFFQDLIGKLNNDIFKTILKMLQKALLLFQKIINIDRTKNKKFKCLFKTDVIEYGAGANWCSITHEFAQYIDARRVGITCAFKYTLNTDECVIQLLALNTSFKEKIYISKYDKTYKAVMRYVKWEDKDTNHPKVFKSPVCHNRCQ